MNGWTRLKIVLSAIYWAVAGLFAWLLAAIEDGTDQPIWPYYLALAAAFYAAMAAIWWAFAGFKRRSA